MRFKLLTLRSVAKPCRLALGVVLLYAGVMKLRDPSQTIAFLEAITFYRAPWLATVAGTLEVALGLALLFSIATPYISRIAIALSVAFFTTHAFSMTLPEPPPPCGCLGTTSNSESLETRMSDSLWWLGLTAGMALCGCMVAAAPAQKKLATQKDQNEPIQEPVHAA